MAEMIELRKERMLPELEQMKRIQLFEDHEIRNIIKERDVHSYRIQRQTKSLRDFLAFIKFEKNLLALVRERRRSKHIPQKQANIDSAILARIKVLYRQTVQRFPEHVRVWDEYIQFCKVYKFETEVSGILDRMIQFHADRPETWQKAVMWEHEEAKNKERVKHFILGGLQRHPKSADLYFTFLKLKLLEGAKLDNDEEQHKALIAQSELIYRDGKENINSIEFIVGVLDIVSQFQFARSLEVAIISDMKGGFSDSPLMWHTLAKRELCGRHLNEIAKENHKPTSSDPKKCIELCVTVYKAACKLLNNEEMWSYYLDTMLELISLPSFALEIKELPVVAAFSAALKEDKINEENFLKFIEFVSENNHLYPKDAFLGILQRATKKYPQSVALWEVLMRFHIEYNEPEEVYSVFRSSALKAIPMKETLPLWELLILFYKSTDSLNKRVMDVYRQAIDLAIPEISNKFKPEFLEYVVQTEGIAPARKEYNKLCLCVPSSLELHRQMARMEAIQEKPDVNAWRKCHEMATQFFGKENIQAWLDFIRFERCSGEPKRVSQLYQRAMSSLDPGLVGSFITEYNLNINKGV